MSLVLEEVTASSIWPISLDEAKRHCKVTNDDDDTYIQDLIYSVTRLGESITSRAFFTSTWRYYLDGLPFKEIRLPKPPVQSVTHIKYHDSADVQKTLATTEYIVDTVSKPARICRAFGTSWPTTYDRPNAVEIEYVSGVTTKDALPKGLKQAMLHHISHLYDMREPVIMGFGLGVQEVPFTLRAMYSPFRVPTFY